MSYKITKNGCWEWQGGRQTFGYGQLRGQLVHRLSYELLRGRIPKGMHICHSCDNPPCMNPDHLWLGTAKENIQDAQRKGRMNPQQTANLRGRTAGFRSEKRSVSDSQVIGIRKRHAAGESSVALGKAYGISQSAAWGIIRRKTYKDVTDPPSPFRKLTHDQVREIRMRLSMGEGTPFIGKQFGVSHQCIYDIRHGRSYRDVK